MINEALKNYILAISSLSDESQGAFFNAFKTWNVPKEHFLVREEQVCNYIFFVSKGAVRIFYYKNEKEITEWIALDEEFLLSMKSFFQRSPSHLIIQTLEASEVWGIHYDDLIKLATTYHDIETWFRKLLSAALILSQNRMDSIQFETAHQRYENLLKQHPNIIRRVPLTHIASFLGITLETLSRMRTKK
jgi:CRP-like cAMP-binding protein